MKYDIRIAIMILFSVKEWSRGSSFTENYPHIFYFSNRLSIRSSFFKFDKFMNPFVNKSLDNHALQLFSTF